MASVSDYVDCARARPLDCSSDGSTVLVLSDQSGTDQLYLVPSAGGPARRCTDFAGAVDDARLVPGSDQIVLSVDESGGERGQLHLLDPVSGALRTVLADPGVVHRLGSVSRDGTRIAYTTSRRNGVDIDVAVHDLASGADRLLYAPGGTCYAGRFSPDGTMLAVLRFSEHAGANSLQLIPLAPTGRPVAISPEPSTAAYGDALWLSDAEGFVCSTNERSDYRQLHRYYPGDATPTPLAVRDGDVSADIDPSGRSLLAVTNVAGYDEVEVLDAHTGERRDLIGLPGRGVVSGARFCGAGRAVFAFESAREPGDVWSYDLVRRSLTRITESRCPLSRDGFVEPAPAWYRTFDGNQVATFVYRPAGQPPWPVVVVLHGGPENQFRPGFDPLVQLLVAHGYAVVAPNVRGSTGYGARWEHLDDRALRHDAVRDVGALHDWIAAQPDLDEQRAVLCGNSYGGYLVLSGLAWQPELWAAGVELYGIADLVTNLENTSPWWRPFREREYGSLERDRAMLRELSPISRLEHMQAPLFVAHGVNDARVPLSQSEQIVGALRAKGVPCEFVVYPDEGHGFTHRAHRIDVHERTLAFLDRTVGARR